MKWLEYVDFIKVSKALRCILQESGDNNKCKIGMIMMIKTQLFGLGDNVDLAEEEVTRTILLLDDHSHWVF